MPGMPDRVYDGFGIDAAEGAGQDVDVRQDQAMPSIQSNRVAESSRSTPALNRERLRQGPIAGERRVLSFSYV